MAILHIHVVKCMGATHVLMKDIAQSISVVLKNSMEGVSCPTILIACIWARDSFHGIFQCNWNPLALVSGTTIIATCVQCSLTRKCPKMPPSDSAFGGSFCLVSIADTKSSYNDCLYCIVCVQCMYMCNIMVTIICDCTTV